MNTTHTYVSRWQLSIAVRILRLVLIENSLLLYHANALLFVSDLTMLLSKGRHLVWIETQFLLLVLLVTDNWLSRLLFVLATVIIIKVVTLYVHNARTLR